MFVDAVPNRNSQPTILIRHAYREGGKARKRTLANITKLPPETAVSTLASQLGLPENLNEDRLYETMGWLLERQPRIEKALAEKHLSGCGSRMSTFVQFAFDSRCAVPVKRQGRGPAGDGCHLRRRPSDPSGRTTSGRTVPISAARGTTGRLARCGSASACRCVSCAERQAPCSRLRRPPIRCPWPCPRGRRSASGVGSCGRRLSTPK